MKVILFGGTGMIGRGVLLESLADPEVESALLVGRRASGAKGKRFPFYAGRASLGA